MAIYQSAKNILERVKDDEVLEKIKNVDGDGSGLDADFLRGLPADFTCNKNSSGYTKLPNGLIIQWGKSTVNISGIGWYNDISVTFPIQFPNDVFYIGMFRENFNTADISVQDRRLHEITNSSFQYGFYVDNIATTGTVNWYWLTIGY